MDLIDREVIGVLPLSNTMAIMITLNAEDSDSIYYQWSDENEAIETDLFMDEKQQSYFVVEGGDKYYLNTFVKVDRNKFEVSKL